MAPVLFPPELKDVLKSRQSLKWNQIFPAMKGFPDGTLWAASTLSLTAGGGLKCVGHGAESPAGQLLTGSTLEPGVVRGAAALLRC